MNELAIRPMLLFSRGAARARRHAAAGFTMVELLTVVVIFGVVAAIAAPSYSLLVAQQTATSTSTDLYSAMARTRGEATKRNVNVWLCPKTSGAAGWKDGWQIQTSNCSALANPALDNHAAINGSTISGPTSVAYQSSGRVQGGTAPAFTITAGSGATSAQKYLCVDLGGRPVVQSSVCT